MEISDVSDNSQGQRVDFDTLKLYFYEHKVKVYNKSKSPFYVVILVYKYKLRKKLLWSGR